MKTLHDLATACLLWNKPFRVGQERVDDLIIREVENTDADEVKKLALHMRSLGARYVSLLLLRELARYQGTFIADTLAEVIQRPDDLTDFVSLVFLDDKRLSGQMKKGLARAFPKFSETELEAYNQRRSVKLRDVMFMTHPHPTSIKQEIAWKRLADDKMEPKDTFYDQMQEVYSVRDFCEEGLKAGTISGSDLVDNLNRMIGVGVNSDLINQALVANAIKGYEASPLTYLEVVGKSSLYAEAAEAAMLITLRQQPKLKGSTCVVVDSSDRMQRTFSHPAPVAQANSIAIQLQAVCEDIKIFSLGSELKGTLPGAGLELRKQIGQCQTSTVNTKYEPHIAEVCSHLKPTDRLIFLTSQNLQHLPKAPCKAYAMNIQNSGNLGIQDINGWAVLEGFSERFVDYIQEIENEV